MMTGSKRSRRRRDDYTKGIESLLDRYGIETYHFERRGKHRSVIITYEDQTRIVFFPSSGSDWRGPRNAVSGLRRALIFLGAAPPPYPPPSPTPAQSTMPRRSGLSDLRTAVAARREGRK